MVSLPHRRSRLPAWVTAFVAYICLAVLMTWPLVSRLGDSFLGANTRDAWGHYWNIWWFRYALTTGRNLFFADLWYPPEGVSLLLATPTPFNGALGLLPQLVAGPLVAYNVVALAAIVLSAQATFLLTQHLTRHAGAAFVAGIAFGASPYLIGHLHVGHLNVAMLLWLPLFAYALLRASDGSRWAVALAALCLPLSALTEWHATLSAGMLAILLIGWASWRSFRGHVAWLAPARMTIACVLGGLLLLPLALAMAQAAAAVGERAEVGEVAARYYSANLLSFVLPNDQHPLWGEAIYTWRRANVAETLTEGRVSLGWTVLLLALVGLWRARWAAVPWLAALALGLALALGPTLHIGPDEVALPMPYNLFTAIPYTSVSRTPARFTVLIVLALAVLAAYGVRLLADRLTGGWRSALAPVVATLLVTGELLTPPFLLTAAPDRSVAETLGRELANDPAATIFHVPALPLEQELLYHQVHHERGIYSTGGSLWRDVERPFRTQTPGFADLMTGRPYYDFVEPAPPPLAALNYFHVRYVLLYAGDVQADKAENLRKTLRRVLEQPSPAHVSPDGEVEAWRVPDVPMPGPFLRAGAGWHPPEDWTGLGMGRWMATSADLYLERPVAEEVTVAFTALSFAAPRRLEVRADGVVIGVYTITPTPEAIQIHLPVAARTTRLTLRSLDGATSPEAVSGARDSRQLSIGLAGVRVLLASAASAGKDE